MPFDPGTPLRVEATGGNRWRLLADLKYEGKRETFVVPAGSETDFASVPRLFTWLVPTSGKYTRAAVLHDFLCNDASFPRNDADGIFRRAMRELGVSTLRRYVIWGAVRLAGGLRGARVGDAVGILLLALLAVPVALPVAFTVLTILAMLWVAEVGVWVVLRAVGRNPGSPHHFWWA